MFWTHDPGHSTFKTDFFAKDVPNKVRGLLLSFEVIFLLITKLVSPLLDVRKSREPLELFKLLLVRFLFLVRLGQLGQKKGLTEMGGLSFVRGAFRMPSQ